MKKTAFTVIIIAAFWFTLAAKESLEPPMAKKIPKEMTIHDDPRQDNYFWLRERDNPDVKAYLAAENAYADAFMKPTSGLQEKLYKEMLSHMKETDLTVPFRYRDYFYYTRTEEGKQYAIQCRKKGSLEAPEEILLDVNKLAEGLKFMSLGAIEISPDGNLMAYSTDSLGYRDYTLQIMDLRTRTLFPEKIERVSSVVWALDNKTLFYTTTDPAKRPFRLYRHELGTDKHELIEEEKDETFRLFAYATKEEEIIFVGSASSNTTEFKYLHSSKPSETPVMILPRETDHEYYPDYYKGKFYILTNKDAKNNRIVSVPMNDPSMQNWKDFVPHEKSVLLEGANFFSNHCVISYRQDAIPSLRVIDLRTGDSHKIEMPEPIYSAYMSANNVFDTNIVRFSYQSLVTPSSIFDYDMDTRKKTLLKQKEVPGGFDSANYVSERTHAPAKDGVKIPVSLVYRKGVKRDGSAPLLLDGYGAYGSSMSAYFDSNRLLLLDRGMICAYAHIRGGGDLGKEWYEQGKMMNKKNTFNDFISVAEHLIAEKYTSPDHLAATGGSAGGLLMGAVMNQRPDLFRVVLNYVPYVDVINTMLDPTIPLVVPEYLEWGNPNKKDEYVYMKSYCPYTNVKAQKYPAMLVRTSFYDSQVPYWEGAKYVAKLRALKTDQNVILLKSAIEAGGHGGQSGRYDSLKEDAFDYAFMLAELGVTN